MERDQELARLRRRVGQELGRELTTSTLFLHTLIANKVGLNATDTRCLEILARSGETRVTAGDLKTATGLTTGAVTGILDRLESTGFARRVRDTKDRRKIFVELLANPNTDLSEIYRGIGLETEALASRYTPEELRLIEGFLESSLEILRRQISALSD